MFAVHKLIWAFLAKLRQQCTFYKVHSNRLLLRSTRLYENDWFTVTINITTTILFTYSVKCLELCHFPWYISFFFRNIEQRYQLQQTAVGTIFVLCYKVAILYRHTQRCWHSSRQKKNCEKGDFRKIVQEDFLSRFCEKRPMRFYDPHSVTKLILCLLDGCPKWPPKPIENQKVASLDIDGTKIQIKCHLLLSLALKM